MVSGGAAEEFPILFGEGRLATGFLPHEQIVEKCYQHSFVINERTGRGPTSLGSLD